MKKIGTIVVYESRLQCTVDKQHCKRGQLIRKQLRAFSLLALGSLNVGRNSYNQVSVFTLNSRSQDSNWHLILLSKLLGFSRRFFFSLSLTSNSFLLHPSQISTAPLHTPSADDLVSHLAEKKETNRNIPLTLHYQTCQPDSLAPISSWYNQSIFLQKHVTRPELHMCLLQELPRVSC